MPDNKDKAVKPEQTSDAAKLKMLEELVVQQDEQIKNLMGAVMELNERSKTTDKPKEPAKASVPKEPFTVDGKQYKFKVAKFMLPHNGSIIKVVSEKATDEIKKILVEHNKTSIIEQV